MLPGSLLVLMFLLPSAPGSATKEFPEVKEYEVVYPKRLHPLQKREAKMPGEKETFETELKYEMTVDGKIAVLYLKKNKNLLAPGYTETYYNSTGKEVTSSPQIMDDCYYQGHILNEKDSDASISTCRGLKGYFSQGDQRYFIEPLSPTHQDEQEHALFKYNAEEDKVNGTCGADDVSWLPGLQQKVNLSSTRLVKLNNQKLQEHKKYIEYYVVLDNGEFKKYNENLDEIRKRVFEMANHINMLYKKLDANVALVGIEIWTDKDKIVITPNASLTLDNFSKWRVKGLLRRKRHDLAQLITSTDLSGAMVGLAFMSSACSPYHAVGIVQIYVQTRWIPVTPTYWFEGIRSCLCALLWLVEKERSHQLPTSQKWNKILSDHSSNLHRVAGTMAHEMGHNLGMIHDTYDCKCPSTVCVMEQRVSFYIPTDFSSCSRINYYKFLEDKLPNCLFNTPLPADIISTPICGNQLIEVGEDCDCGSPEECTNICCDAKTCKTKAGFQCASGECCEKCQLKKAGRVCRPANNECDLPEMCDGKSSRCSSDRFRVNGFPCQNGRGYCLNGQCPTLQQQCTQMWGPGTKAADESCYHKNKDGSKYGYCHIENDTHIPCKAKDIMCGKLFCQGGSSYLPWKGFIISFQTCKLFDPEDTSQGIDMVANGTKCGKNKVCMNAECVDMERTYKSTNCSSKCKGHAVCDHELQCQCEEGWAPPDCDDSSVFHFSIVTGVLFPVAVIFVVVAIAIRHQSARRKGKKVQRSLSPTDTRPHTQKSKPQMVKAIQPQELITKPDFPPPPIPTSVTSSFLDSKPKV